MHTALLIALSLALVFSVLGVALIAYAKFNPKWQSADSYDCLLPYYAGKYLLIAAIVLAIAGLFGFFATILPLRF